MSTRRSSPQKDTTAYVAMSGGVDSSVAALLLIRAGYHVVGVFMKPWQPKGMQCLWERDREDALRVAATLNIPLKTWDFSREYGRLVAQPMIRGYRRGITPNPDVACNSHIKFGLFFRRAMKEGADVVATGHYAHIQKSGGISLLTRPKDRNKDQTYFLWDIDPRRLDRVLFPLGNLKKPEVRKLAKKAKLVVAEKKDSQGVCFVGELDVKEFLKQRIPSKSGMILHADGRNLGTHDGAAYYTIGQRHGLDIRDGGGPYYVISKDIRRNTVTVGNESDLFSSATKITHQNWFIARPRGTIKVNVQIRYRTPAVPATLLPSGVLRFARPVRAIAPGQSAVLYRRNQVIGGGILTFSS
jgi:tRNA-uridine 2-sulfurtransferase